LRFPGGAIAKVAYSEPHRKHHTIEHIGSLLRQLEEHGHAVVDRDAVVLAMLFHDVVYDPLRHDVSRLASSSGIDSCKIAGGGLSVKNARMACQ
jgi:predicted metal-dependent HD superfamily phosphohydrolase